MRDQELLGSYGNGLGRRKNSILGMGAGQDSNCEGFNIQVDRVPELLEAPVNLYFASF